MAMIDRNTYEDDFERKIHLVNPCHVEGCQNVGFKSIYIQEKKFHEWVCELHFKEAEKNSHSELTQGKIHKANIPISLKDSTFKGYDNQNDANIKVTVEAVYHFITNQERLFLLVGNHGVGKTHLGVALIKQYLKNNPTCEAYYESAMTLSTKLENINRRVEVMDEYKSYNLLVLDEMGRESQTDSKIEKFTDILYSRYDNDRKTFLISNLTLEAWKEFPLYKALKDRLKTIYGINGESRR